MQNTYHNYINIHTHRPVLKNSVLEVENVRFGKESIPNAFFSLGIHPWDVYLFNSFPKEQMENALLNDNCLFLGEIGLDSLHPNFQRQREVFANQVALASNFGMPILIHCVKAYNEVFQILSESKFKFPVIFHAYNGNAQLTTQLLKFDAYFSIGELLLRESSTIRKYVSSIPIDRLFFETDSSECTIDSIYSEAEMLLELDIAVLQESVRGNFNRLFS